MRKTISLILFCALFAAVLGGCVYPSGDKTLGQAEEPNYSINPKAQDIIDKAITKTDKEGRKFWYNGWTATKIQKRRSTSMYNGTFDRELGYLVQARVMGQDFRYYRYGDEVYISEGDNWIKASPTDKPLEPFDGFRSIAPFTKKARQLPDEQVLGRDCYVFEIPLRGTEVAQISKEIGAVSAEPLQDFLLEQLSMDYRIWIGKKDSFIYQLKTDTSMPVPKAGTMTQEVYFRFWDYNSPSVTLTEPESIMPYVKEK